MHKRDEFGWVLMSVRRFLWQCDDAVHEIQGQKNGGSWQIGWVTSFRAKLETLLLVGVCFLECL